MSDKNLEQRINIKFCLKIGKGAGETLAILTIISRSAQLIKESISKVKAAVRAQVNKFCFHRAILGIKFSQIIFCKGRKV